MTCALSLNFLGSMCARMSPVCAESLTSAPFIPPDLIETPQKEIQPTQTKFLREPEGTLARGPDSKAQVFQRHPHLNADLCVFVWCVFCLEFVLGHYCLPRARRVPGAAPEVGGCRRGCRMRHRGSPPSWCCSGNGLLNCDLASLFQPFPRVGTQSFINFIHLHNSPLFASRDNLYS